MTEVAALGLSVDSGDVVSATDDLNKFADASDKAGKASDNLTPKTKRTGDEIDRTGGKAKKTTTIFGSLLRSITGLDLAAMGLAGAAARLGGTLAAAFSVRAIIGYADAWSDMQSKVGAAIKDMSAAPELMGRMVDLANASYSPLDQTVEVYTRNVAVLRDLGKTAMETADFTEALNHALVITATRGERAASVQNALSKAMAIGKLTGDGLETVMANGGRVAEALAEKLGTNVNGLRAMASQGKITSAVIAGALLDSLEKLRTEAGEMPATVADGMTRIATGIQYLIGVLDQTTGASGSLAGVLLMIGDALSSVARWAEVNGATIQFVFDSLIGTAIVGATALVVKFAATWAVSMAAAAGATTLFSGALTALKRALIASGIGIAVILAGVLVGQLLKLIQAAGGVGQAFTLIGEVIGEAWSRVTLMFDAMVARFNAGWLDMEAAVLDWVVGAIGNVVHFGDRAAAIFQGSYDAVVAVWSSLPEAIGDFVFQAVNSLISGVESMINGIVSRINLFIGGLNKALALLPEWATSGGIAIGLLDDVGLGRVDNPYAGKAAAAGDAASGAFDAAMGRTYLTAPVTGLGDRANTAREQASAYREAGRMLDQAAQKPMTAWERLKSLFTETEEEVQETTESVDGLGDSMAAAGGKGKKAADEAKDSMMTLKSATEDFRGTMASAFTGLVTGALSLRDAVGNIISKLAEMAATRGFEMLWSGGLGKSAGGFLGALLGFADGGVFSDGRVTAFANGGVVSGPTVFPMAGGTGLMGEAGPEAIMPLKRGSDGKLGVQVSSGDGKSAQQALHVTAEIIDNGGLRVMVRDEAGKLLAEAAPQIVQQSVQSTGRAMSKTKAFGNGSI